MFYYIQQKQDQNIKYKDFDFKKGKSKIFEIDPKGRVYRGLRAICLIERWKLFASKEEKGKFEEVNIKEESSEIARIKALGHVKTLEDELKESKEAYIKTQEAFIDLSKENQELLKRLEKYEKDSK